ncbi:hypothetical protein C8P66_10225 [Humitalea rosea]|uniref:SGNH domain-containing protein n=1 Tax=Humitalea rosea TaxID=990373 RepID=A0A2W7IVN7_9PROT|nr:SGNH/GDSL hydrolase family protein [Humitalea rosea]PZW50337.1 hypothetical protein C8P66_10225 [Humitalea rosea]
MITEIKDMTIHIATPRHPTLRNRVALLGDSRMGGSTRVGGQRLNAEDVDENRVKPGTAVFHSAYSFASWADALLDGELGFQHSDNYGFHDGTTNGVLGRVPSLIEKQRYWACIYSAGTNDPKPENGPVSFEGSMTAMARCWDQLLAEGIRVFIVQDLPRNSVAWAKFGFAGEDLTRLHARMAGIRRFVADYAASHEKIHVIDPLPSVMSVHASEPLSLLHFDGTHTSPWGGWRVGTLLADAMRPYLPRRGLLLADAGDRFDAATNPHGTLLPNGLMLIDSSETNAQALPDGWIAFDPSAPVDGQIETTTQRALGGFGNGVAIKARGATLARTNGLIGIRARVSVPRSAAGRVVEAMAVVHIKSGATGLRGVTCRLAAFDGMNTPPRLATAFEDGPAHLWPSEVAHRLVLRSPALAAPQDESGALEVQLLARLDSDELSGANFDVSFERASLRIVE